MAAEQQRLTLRSIRGDLRDIHQIVWPGTTQPVGILLLRCSEIQEAHFAAVDHFRRKGQPIELQSVNMGEFLREKERQEVFRMLLQPGSQRPQDRLFAKVDDVRDELDLDEVAWVMGEHERMRQARSIKLGLLTPVDEQSRED